MEHELVALKSEGGGSWGTQAATLMLLLISLIGLSYNYTPFIGCVTMVLTLILLLSFISCISLTELLHIFDSPPR